MRPSTLRFGQRLQRFTSTTRHFRQTPRVRYIATAAAQKGEGTIADAFASLSGQAFGPLEPRFTSIKQSLIAGHEAAVVASWQRLLSRLHTATAAVAAAGPSIVPELRYEDLNSPSSAFSAAYHAHGVAIIRGVVPSDEARDLLSDTKRYIKANPHTKAFPPDDPQVYELYWSPAQMRARTHPQLLSAQRFLLRQWHAGSTDRVVAEPIVYADRLRIRSPGDARFALGPHMDGGGPERWEAAGYRGKDGPYAAIFRGEWEAYDAWAVGPRLSVESDLYAGKGACSAFRMSQGWLALSNTAPGEGTLLVNPLLAESTAYVLLRPFFRPRRAPDGYAQGRASADELADPQFLAADNWTLESPVSAWLHGATPGRGQELSPVFHPHLRLDTTMVHVPRVAPGDYVVWHCDTIHAVDRVHAGKEDSSVMYIPACPLTERNAAYLEKQRDAFMQGTPGPDFPGGEGESRHVGRPGVADLAQVTDKTGMRAFGLEPWNSNLRGVSTGEQQVMSSANQMLGFPL